MPRHQQSMLNPSQEDLLEQIDSKFLLVVTAAKRARQITDYTSNLGLGAGRLVPPQVMSFAAKSLTIALEEIAAGKIIPVVSDAETDE